MALLGCPRGHRVGLKLRLLRAWLIPTEDTHPRTRALSAGESRICNLAFRRALCAQAAFDFRCSALNDSPFFQIFKAMAAILRARVKRAISGRIPLLSSPR